MKLIHVVAYMCSLLFSLLLNISVDEYATIFVDGYSGCFQYLGITNSVAMKFFYMSLGCKVVGVQLLGILILKFKRRDKGQ